MKINVDRSNVSKFLKYINKQPVLNTFMIGDYEQFGFRNDNVKYYMFYNQQELELVALVYYTNVILYSSNNEFDIDEVVNWILDINPHIIQGPLSTLNLLYSKIKTNYPHKKDKFFCEYQGKDAFETAETIYHATISDVDEIFKLSLLTFGEDESYIESTKEKLLWGATRIYCIKDHGKIVCTAETGIETESSAMISNVATDPKHRGKGYATAVIGSISADLLKVGKHACLFYDNEAAGRIYKNVGYVQTNMWCMIERGDLDVNYTDNI